jgi:hypothetical protein
MCQRPATPTLGPIDWIGQVTFAAGVGALITVPIKGGDWGWASTGTSALAATAVLSLAAFVLSQARRQEPMLDLALLRNCWFAGSAIAAFATSASLFGMFVYLILYFQNVEGVDGLHAGTRLLPVTVLAFVAAAAGAGRLSAVVSARLVLTVALGCGAAGLLQMTMLGAGSSWTVALPGSCSAAGVLGWPTQQWPRSRLPLRPQTRPRQPPA